MGCAPTNPAGVAFKAQPVCSIREMIYSQICFASLPLELAMLVGKTTTAMNHEMVDGLY
jgi:hypothetical protein